MAWWTAPTSRHHTASHVQDLAQEMLPNLLKDVDEGTIFDFNEEEEQEEEGGAAAIKTEPTSRSRRGNMWRSRASIGRRADVEPPALGSVIRMERGGKASQVCTSKAFRPNRDGCGA